MIVECKFCKEQFEDDEDSIEKHFREKHPDIFSLYKKSDRYKERHRWDFIKRRYK